MRQQARHHVVVVTHDIDEAVYLSDRVVVLTHSPTEVKEIVRGRRWPAPRDQITTKELPEFVHLREHVYRLIGGSFRFRNQYRSRREWDETKA